MLSYISTYLASHPRTTATTAQSYATSNTASGSNNTAPSSRALSAEARMWQVDWSELHVERAIGRGSFGCVYLARWNETRVAVKVLLNKGEVMRGVVAGRCGAWNGGSHIGGGMASQF